MESTNINKLPIFANNHYDSSSIGEVSEISKKLGAFRKGEKGLYNIIKLGAVGAVGYFSWVYVLPPLFQAIGQMLAIASTLVISVILIFLAPVFLRWLRYFTRACHQAVIKHNPFAVFEEQRAKIVQNKKKFHISKGNVSKLKDDMFRYSAEAEDKAKDLQKRITTLDKKVNEIKVKMTKIINTKGKDAQTDDEYINCHIEYTKYLSESQRRIFELEQQQGFVVKYGARADVMKKLEQKLTLVEGSMENKILDFDATINILKRDYEFAKNAKEATTTAKNAMMFTEGWEFDFAMNVVTSTIAQDIALTSSNLKDIDSYTANFNIDSDELFNNLSTLAEEIKVGEHVIPDAKAYTAPNYQQTHNDRLNSGGFGNVF